MESRIETIRDACGTCERFDCTIEECVDFCVDCLYSYVHTGTFSNHVQKEVTDDAQNS